MNCSRFSFLLAVTIVLSCFITTAHADKFAEAKGVFQKAPETQNFFKNAYGYALFPTIGKGGFVVGGAYGKGQVYRQGKAVGTTSMVKGTIGLQLGGQAFSEIIFFEDKRAFDEFTSGQFEFDAAASAVAITAGAQAKAGTEGATAGASAGSEKGAQAEAKYHKGMVVFVHTKGGLMYEAAIGGQKFTYEAL